MPKMPGVLVDLYGDIGEIFLHVIRPYGPQGCVAFSPENIGR
jgi:L,D-peptidoglycan transpeptidase YkuD (ErfK/YbiS/YcfS/YnhG family)